MMGMAASIGLADVERIVALLNTHYLPDGDDVLGDERAADWVADWLGGPVPPFPRRTERAESNALRRLREIREGLRQMAAVNNGQQPDEQSIARAAAALASRRFVLDLGDYRRRPGIALPPNASLMDRAVASLTECYLTARVGKNWARLKACAAPDCRYAYLDTSRNRSRRWCEMAYCGNRAKNRAWRDRQLPAAQA